MKKIINLCLICLVSITTLVGCNKDKKIKKFVLEGQKGIETFVDIDKEGLENKISRGDDFILYIYGTTCGSCAMFTPKMISFIQNTESVIYRIDASYVVNSSLVPGLKNTPSLVFYNEGVMQKLVDPSKNSDPFSSVEKLTKYIQKYAYLPQMKEISKTQLDELISNNQDFVLYIASGSCGDCAHFKKNVLTPYLKENTIDEEFYFIDVDKFLSRSENGQTTQDWTDFKNQYGLSKIGNATYGYGSGYVPTIQRYSSGVITDAMVYLNDVTFENDQLVVTEGYYGMESGKVGKTYTDYSAYQDDLCSFYKNKFIEFMSR